MKFSKNAQTERIGVQLAGKLFEKSGYIFREQPISDYGIDAHIELVENQKVSGKLIALQIKSGSTWIKEEKEDSFIFRGDKEHLDYWLDHSLPVLVVLCDIEKEICYWQAIYPSNVIHTGEGWKLEVPKFQTINPGMDVDLQRLVKKLRPYKSWTIASISDMSHGTAKRYSIKIILNREHTQAEIIELIKVETVENINCDYYRSDITQIHWRKTPAHVVWLFIYPSSEDETNNNFLCQTEWFSEELDSIQLPSSIGGEEIAPNLRVVWNTGYLGISRHYSQNTLSKQDFIQACDSLTGQILPLVEFSASLLKKFNDKEVNYEYLIEELSKRHPIVDELYISGTDLGPAPYECKDMSQKFQSLLAFAHNIFIYFNDSGNQHAPETILFNLKSQIGYFFEALQEFEFEIKKIR